MPGLFTIPFAELMARPATWHEGIPCLDGLSKYMTMIRSPHDPERLSRKQARELGKGFEAWPGGPSSRTALCGSHCGQGHRSRRRRDGYPYKTSPARPVCG